MPFWTDLVGSTVASPVRDFSVSPAVMGAPDEGRGHGIEDCSGQRLKPGCMRERRQLAGDVPHRLEGDLGDALPR
jgi:hypothetical protein